MRDPLLEPVARAADILLAAERPIRVLRTVGWAPSVKRRFFAAGARELPKVEYERVDVHHTLEAVAKARELCVGSSNAERWVRRQADAVERSARMLASVGTPAFYEHSAALYGTPKAPLADEVRTPLELARELDAVLSAYSAVDLGAPPAACHLSTFIADQVRVAVIAHFGEDAPDVEIVEHLSANALAKARAILIRRDACFTDRDAQQLIQHEALVHVLTSLNGHYQQRLPLLSAGHGGTTRTQEGLAVFAELINGGLDPDRLRRLADRVIAIQMAIDGADFLDVYGYFLERTGAAEQAFENARRVFRGGVLEGGAPFTKDAVYLDGLLRVHDFLRVAVKAGRADAIRTLFVGKLDIEDVPALCELTLAGLVAPPRFLPPWVLDLRTLVASLAYATFLDRVDLRRVEARYGELLASAPRLPSVVNEE
ncbi:MAG: flavohemoglobin expression-modulating QEGLA motif protein [Nannocystaceae bacterium]